MKNKEVILGLDCSTTSTGWCIFDDKGLAAYGVIKPEGEDWRERLTKQAPKLKNIIERYKPNKIVMEDVPLNSQGGLKILVVLGAVQGLVLGVASSLNIPIKFVTPNEWRSKVRLFTGNRRSSHLHLYGRRRSACGERRKLTHPEGDHRRTRRRIRLRQEHDGAIDHAAAAPSGADRQRPHPVWRERSHDFDG